MMNERLNYILDKDGNPVPEPDIRKWADWYEEDKRRVALTILKRPFKDDVSISTVFLGIDHSFSFGGPPILFETMIFGGEHDQWQDRYFTRVESLQGHAEAVELAKQSLYGRRNILVDMITWTYRRLRRLYKLVSYLIRKRAEKVKISNPGYLKVNEYFKSLRKDK
jgi:hypothetical protein